MRNPYLSLLRTAWRYARGARRRYLLVYGLFACSNTTFALYPILLGWFVDAIQGGQWNPMQAALVFGVSYVTLKVIEWSFHAPARIMERQLAFDLSRNFLTERYHQALHLPVRWHTDHHSGSTANRIRKGYEALKSFFDNGYMYVHALSKLIFSVAAMLYFSPLFGGIGVLIGIAVVALILRFDRPLVAAQEEVNEREHVLTATLLDGLSNIITVLTLRLESGMERGLGIRIQDLWKPFRRLAVLNECKWFSAEVLVALIYAVVAVGYVHQHWVTGETFLVGGLVMLLAYVEQFTSVFHDVAWQYTQIVTYDTEVCTARSIEEAYADQRRPAPTGGVPPGWHDIDVRGLSFSHQDSYSDTNATQSLHDISLTLARGQRIALVGPSGSGKSTVLALLRGLYDPEPGCVVAIDGAPGTIGQIAQSTTLFPQEPEIFENTIAYNITLGLPFDQAEIERVCDTACFTEIADQLPGRLEAGIQERGVNLSGGQKQRLALARGILSARHSELVLLDEPTSAVDPRTESRIYRNLFAAFQDSCVVSALHRLHLLPLFDRIYLLDAGRVVGQGTFNELLATNALFQELWRHDQNHPTHRDLSPV